MSLQQLADGVVEDISTLLDGKTDISKYFADRQKSSIIGNAEYTIRLHRCG